MEQFIAWVIASIIPLREELGYRVEFKFADWDKSEFVWMVSREGDRAQFEAADAFYHSSPQRAEVIKSIPTPPLKQHISFVEPS
jgi:hypothetical protein